MKEKTLIKILALVTLAFGVLAFAMMFFGAVTTGGDNPIIYKGMELAFGKDLGKIDLWLAKGEGSIKFSFGVLLAYTLPLIAGLLLGLIDLLSKKKGTKFLFGVIAFAGFIFSIANSNAIAVNALSPPDNKDMF